MNSIDIFPWNENFNTGLPKIDEQHRKLVQLLNLLASHLAFQSDIPALNVIFDELADYAAYHFQTEEAIWLEYFQEDVLLSNHKQIHDKFLVTVLQLRGEENVKPTDEVIGEILAFLTRWLASHILENDRYLAMVVLAIQSGMSIELAKKYANEQLSGSIRVLVDIILSIYETLSTNTLHLMRELAKRRRDEESLRKLSLVVEQSPNAIIITDLDANIEFVNEAFVRTTGFSRSEAIGYNPRLLQSDKTPKETFVDLWDTLARGEAWKGELFNKRKDGSEYADLVLISPVHQSDGNITHYLSIQEDITERKKAEIALLESHQQLYSLLNSMAEGAYGVDTNGNCTFVNKSFLRILGYENANEIIGKYIHELIHHSHPDGSLYPATECRMYAAYRCNEEIHVSDEVFWRKDGMPVPVEYWSQPIITNGVMSGAIATFVDITERTQAEHQLRIAAIAFESQEGMLITDTNNVILRVNQAFTDITGYTAENVVGENPRIFQSDRQNKNFYAAMWNSINATGKWEGEIWNRRKNGEIFPEYLIITAVKNLEGIVTHYVATYTDITQRKLAAEEIERLAFYDPLTGLPNRRLLQDRLKPALASSHRSGRKGSLLFIDLDNFKTLNDTVGHDIGDLLLKQVAQRFEGCVREGDTVARLGGDEFVVLLEDLSEQTFEAATQTEIIGKKILATLNQPHRLNTHEYLGSASIGAALFNGYELSVDELLKHADIAMYQAKTSGRNTLRFFDPQMQKDIATRVALENGLRKALGSRQFHLHYQLQVDSSHNLLGAEALIRWIHPEHGMVSPAEFIPLAEETGLILPIGRWVVETACAQLQAWQRESMTRDLVLSVNVSAKQFFQADLVPQMRAFIQQYGINPMLLKLELTESILVENIEDTIATMNALGDLGVQFSLDDFGTGYSSLQYLKKLPLNQLKIDQSFVHDIAVDSGDQAIVCTIIAMAASLNLNVIAEGVETEDQRQFLLNNGCTNYQGYLFSKPVPIDEFEALLKQVCLTSDNNTKL